jgi:hypothetical protein
MRTHADRAAGAWRAEKLYSKIIAAGVIDAVIAIPLHAVLFAAGGALAAILAWKGKQSAAEAGRRHFLRADTQRGIPDRVTGEYSAREQYRMAKSWRQASGD